MPTVILTLPGIIVSAVLFVLFYRTRKQEPWIRRRILLLFIMMLVHTLLYYPASGPETAFLAKLCGALWFISFPVFLIVIILYLVHFNEWNNHDLRVATSVFAGYAMFILLLALLASLFMPTI